MQGRTQLTQQALIDERSTEHPATLAVFDILSKDGKSSLKKSFIERRDMLHKIITQGDHLELLP